MSIGLFFCLALIAEIIWTVWWFGSSILFVPLAGFFLPFHEVLGITALFHVFSNIAKLALFYKDIRRNLLLSIGIPSIIFVAIWALMSKYVSGELASLFLWVFCISFSLLLLLRPTRHIATTKKNLILSGSAAGWLAGIIWTGWAIRGMTLTALNLEKSIYIATSAGIDFWVDTTRSLIYFLQWYMHEINLLYVIWLICIAFIWSYIGKLIIKRISQNAFRLFVLLFILFTGVVMLYKYIASTL